MNDQPKLTRAELAQFSGSEQWHQLWKLTVKPDHTAVLTCEDGNGEAVVSKHIPFTDFPLDEIKFYVTNSTILLPSEY